jgi:dimethylamine monooxygenase subunit A
MVLHDALPFAPWADPRARRLPGIQPLDMADWLRVDETYAGQMAIRDRLIAESPALVHALDIAAVPAAQELFDKVLGVLPGLGFVIVDGQVLRPDRVMVTLDRNAPLLTLGRLCQNDFCLMEKQGAEHVLTGAILCFPGSWTLAEKFGQPMVRIHKPVEDYTPDLARRVQRLFDAIRVETPLWRSTALLYADAELHHPRREDSPRIEPAAGPTYLRSERQTLVRLARSQAVAFGIHTYLIPVERLNADQAAAMAEFGLAHAND